MTGMAQLCQACGLGNQKWNCALCGAWVGPYRGTQARLCGDCKFERSADCAVCGGWTGGRGIPAVLCRECASGPSNEGCIRCGKWAP